MNQDVINWKNGDFAVENKLKVIYDYHLSNKTECVFTSKSLNFAIVNKDIELVKQLLDKGVKYRHKTCRKSLEESTKEIHDIIVQTKKHCSLLINKSCEDHICETSTGLHIDEPTNGLVNYGATINGNVGIGTMTPKHKLHVVGSTKLEGDTYINNLVCQSVRVDSFCNYTVTLSDNVIYAEGASHILFPTNDTFKGKLIKVVCLIDASNFNYDRDYPTLHFGDSIDDNDSNIHVQSHDGDRHISEYSVIYTLHYHNNWNVIGLNVINSQMY